MIRPAYLLYRFLTPAGYYIYYYIMCVRVLQYLSDIVAAGCLSDRITSQISRQICRKQRPPQQHRHRSHVIYIKGIYITGQVQGTLVKFRIKRAIAAWHDTFSSWPLTAVTHTYDLTILYNSRSQTFSTSNLYARIYPTSAHMRN